MTPPRPLLLGAQEQAAKEFTFHTEIIVLPRGIVHVDVHGADGHTLPWIGNRAIRAAGVVRCSDRCWIRIKNCITDVRLEVDQGIKWRVPRAVGPDVVEDAVVEDSITTSHRHLTLTLRVPSKADTGAKVMVLRIPHAAGGSHTRVPYTIVCIRGEVAPTEVEELRDNPVSLARGAKALPAKPQIKGQVAGNLPIVLRKRGV